MFDSADRQSRLECLVCHSLVNRMDRHILQNSDTLTEKHRRFILDFYRTKNTSSKKVIYDCLTCFRRFASLVTHKHVNKCECSNVQKVNNPESRSFLPQEIRIAVKSSILPSKKDLETAQRFVDYRSNLTKCSGPEKKGSQDRYGIGQLMGHKFSMTVGLKKPELLVKGCLDLQERRGLKPQTMLNYLSTFLLFVDYCFLADEIDRKTNDLERIKAAIRDARKAFSPAAVDYRKTAEEMQARVPSSDMVRERYSKILQILKANLVDNTLKYRTQQVLNFFILQGRINTRFVALNRT